MKHPPYNLRPNKAIDRFLLIEALLLLAKGNDISKFTYHGFGGPFLDDCRLIGQYFPQMSLVSIETNEQTWHRQKFHKPSKRIKLQNDNSVGYLAQFPSGGNHVFWFDYTDLKYGCFDDFKNVLGKVGKPSLVKFTVRAEAPDNPFKGILHDKLAEQLQETYIEEFRRQFDQVLPGQISSTNFRDNPFILLVQNMFKIAAQQALPAESGYQFHIINSSFYSDQTTMYSLTGVVASTDDMARNIALFKDWEHANLTWEEPKRIDVPNLSLKEMFHLDSYLPCEKTDAATLADALGYHIDNGRTKTIQKLEQYLSYYRFYPHFAKVTV